MSAWEWVALVAAVPVTYFTADEARAYLRRTRRGDDA